MEISFISCTNVSGTCSAIAVLFVLHGGSSFPALGLLVHSPTV